jgi:hypothetical protein
MHKKGGHYNHYAVHTDKAMQMFREYFPEGMCDDMNLVFFSTSGVHGTYNTIEEVEETIRAGFPESTDDKYYPDELTFVYLRPRLCTIYYGLVKPQTMEDIYLLKSLRETSWESAVTIGRKETK